MKRSLYLLALAAPFMLGAALPPAQRLPGNAQRDVIEVNAFDRFLQDTGIQKRKQPSQRSRSRTQKARNAAPAVPPIAKIPVPLPKPAESAQAGIPEEQATKGGETGNATPTATAPTPPNDGAEHSQVSTPPVVEQPASDGEPARSAEVPKPLDKPDMPQASDVKPETAPAEDAAKPEKPAKADAKPDGKQEEESEKAEAEPPPPLVKEDPQELQACLTDLKAIGAKFEPTDPIDEGNGCGIEHPIDVAEVLPGVDLGGATMRCKTALTMAHWLKDTVQPALSIAMPVRRITGLVPGSTYQCRLRNSASTGKISEHARGNAYDVAAFKLDNGETIEMKPREEDSTLEGAFQRTATAGACLHFTTVLSPGSDAAHEDHLHLDILERNGGYRYCR